MARKATKPWQVRVYCVLWRDDDWRNMGHLAQVVGIHAISLLAAHCSMGGKHYTAADFDMAPWDFEDAARPLVGLGVFTWVDDETVEVWPYKDLIVPVPIKWRARIPLAIRERVLARDNHSCNHCGRTDRLEMDHVIPWSLGGSDDEENLQVLCRSCNYRKGASV